MNMPSENSIDSRSVKQRFHRLSHALALALVRRVGAVPGRVEEHEEPRSDPPVDLDQVGRQPLVLRGAGVEVGVGAQHNDMDSASGGVE